MTNVTWTVIELPLFQKRCFVTYDYEDIIIIIIIIINVVVVVVAAAACNRNIFPGRT